MQILLRVVNPSFILVYLLVGLSALSSIKSTHAFDHGTVYDPNQALHSPFIENVVTFKPFSKDACTGVLLGGEWVLLVRHCLRSPTDLDSQPILWKGRQISLTELRVFSGNIDDPREVVLAKLSEKITLEKSFRFANTRDILEWHQFPSQQKVFVSAGFGRMKKNDRSAGPLNFGKMESMGSLQFPNTNNVKTIISSDQAFHEERFQIMFPAYDTPSDREKLINPRGPLLHDSGSALFDESTGVLWGLGTSPATTIPARRQTLANPEGEAINLPIVRYLFLPDYYEWMAGAMREMQGEVPEALLEVLEERKN